MNRIFFLSLIALALGCTKGNDGSSFIDRSTGTIPAYSTHAFRTVVANLIEEKRYRDAVDYLESSDAQLQADYDKAGFLAVGEDLIVLPGVYPEYEYERDRDWCFPGTSDAIENDLWQSASTSFAARYNKHRIGK